MAHTATESFAIAPHNIEASRVETLVPHQLRNNASNLINLLTEYYDYMNEDGIVRGVNIVNDGGGGVIQYADLLKSNAILGIQIADFIPANYNQQYIQLTDAERNQLVLDTIDTNLVLRPSIVYKGLTNPNYFVMKLGNRESAEHSLTNTWVMVFSNNGQLQCDFYDSGRDLSLGSTQEAVDQVIFRGNTGGSFKNLDTTTAPAAFNIGNIIPIALSTTQVGQSSAIRTTLINFENIETKGGHGTGLTIDIQTSDGRIVGVNPNTPGYGYRIDDYLEIDIIPGSVLTVSDVVASPSNVVRRILNEHDIDKTSDDYIGRIQKEIATGIPDARNLDKNTLYKKIVEYYNTRGSESSIESFFKIFFDEIVTVSYPKDFLFKPSDGVYQGSSAVSITAERYYYKNGYDEARRIGFLENSKYNDIRTGTYFIDLEFGDDFERYYEQSGLTGTQKISNIKKTPIFAGSNTYRGRGSTGLGRLGYADMGVSIQIGDDVSSTPNKNDLFVRGRIGRNQNEFEARFQNYVSGTSDKPFSQPENDAKKRLRLAITVDIEQKYENVWSGVNKGRGSATGVVSNVTNLNLTTAGVTGTIEAGQYVRQQGAKGLPTAESIKVVSYNSSTGALVLDKKITLSSAELNLEFYHPHFVLGEVKVGILNGNTGTYVIATNTTSTQNYGSGNNALGIPINGTYESNLYPGALGSAFNYGQLAGINDARENPNAPIYFYGFGFRPAISTETEMTNYLVGKVIPLDKIIDLELNNNGSVNLTNKGRSVIVAKSITGGGLIETRTDGTTFTPPIKETNYGLSSTGSEYPRKITWKNAKGFLSNVIKLHDGDYYQEFSYLIRTQLSVDNWETEFNKLVHPAGMKFFTALYLQLALERVDAVNAPVLDPTSLKGWLPELQKLTTPNGVILPGGVAATGVHSPKWQPGWFEYFRSVYLEIILYEKYSAFYRLKQEAYNKKEDIKYDYDSGLELTGPSTLTGNTKKAIVDSTNTAITIDDQYIELDGVGTGIRTSGKLNLDSEFEMTFKLKEIFGSNIKGRFLAGTRFRGLDGSIRELSIKGHSDNKVAVNVSDYDAETITGKSNADFDKLYEAIEVTGTNYNHNTHGHGVRFTDTSVSQESAGDGSGAGTHEIYKGTRGHNLIIFTPSTKKYRYFNFDTYGVDTSAAQTNEHALHDKIRDASAGSVIILWSYDAAGCHVNVNNYFGGGTNGSYDFKSSLGFGDGFDVKEGLRWALVRYCGAPDAQTLFGRINNSSGFSDQLESSSRHRISHVFIGTRNSLSVGDSISSLSQHVDVNCIEKCSVDTGSDRPLTATMQYHAQTHNKQVSGQSVSSTILRKGPFKRDRFLELSDSDKGLNFSSAEVIDLGTPGTFRTINVKPNGEIKLDGTIVRSEKEASSPKNLKEILLENFDYSSSLSSIKVDNTIDLFRFEADRSNDSNRTHAAANSSAGFYYDEDEKGIVVLGGNHFLSLLNKTVIGNVDDKFDIEVVIKNIGDKPNDISIGQLSLDSSGNPIFTDKFGLYNYGGARNQTLGVNEEGIFNFTIGGYNSSTTTTDTADRETKFDPGAKFFNLILASNFRNNQLWTNRLANKPFTLIKKISIKRQDGAAIEFDSITKDNPNWGVKKITSLSLPPLTETSSVTDIEENSIALGTINIDKASAGITTGDTSFTDTNLYKDFLPWTTGSGSCTINGGFWQLNGSVSEQRREVTTGPMGEAEVTWVAVNQSTENGGDGGFNGPAIAIDPTKDHRITYYFKVKDRDAIARFYFGIRAAMERSVGVNKGDGVSIGNQINTSTQDLPLIAIQPNKGGNNHTGSATIISMDVGATTILTIRRTGGSKLFANAGIGEPFIFEGFHSIDFTNATSLSSTNQGENIYFAKPIGDATTGVTIGNTFRPDQLVEVYNDQKVDFGTNKLSTNGGVTATINPFGNAIVKKKGTGINQYVYHPLMSAGPYIEDKWYMVNTYIKASPKGDAPYRENSLAQGVPDWVGVFDLCTGEKVVGPDFTNATNGVRSYQFTNDDVKRFMVRQYQFYNATSDKDEVEFATPKIEVLDGTEIPHEDLFSLLRHRVSQYPASIQISKSTLSSNDKSNDFKIDISEDREEAESTTGGKHHYEVQPITSVPATETGDVSDSHIFVHNESKSIRNLYNQLQNLNEVATIHSTGIRNIRGQTHINSLYSSILNQKFVIKSTDYTTSGSGSGATFEAQVRKTSSHYFIRLTIIDNGIGFIPSETITIPDNKLGSTGASNAVFKVVTTGPGNINRPNTHAIHPADNKLTLGLNGNNSFERNKEYEISFDTTRIFDYNLPSNLYISGGNRIGYYKNLTGVTNPTNAWGNPHIQVGQSNHGDGPHEFIFNSTVEGFARIFLVGSEMEGGFRLAHNGHELRVDDTNTTRINDDQQPMNWFISNNEHGNMLDNRTVQDENRSADGRAQTNKLFLEDSVNNPNPNLGNSVLFVFESEWLTYGENVIQIYCVAGDGIRLRWLEVAPANQGLITEGSNTHTIYMGDDTDDTSIIIDSKIDRGAGRYQLGSLAGLSSSTITTLSAIATYVSNYEKQYAYAYKFENISIREKRKLLYKGEFKSIVGDAPESFSGTTNNNPTYGTPQYRPLDITSTSATDGVLASGGSVRVPSTDTYDSTSGIGGRLTGGNLSLGIPKGNYGALKFTAADSAVHYLDIGSDTTRFPYDAENEISTYKPNEQYEISGEVFIPTSNTKLEHVKIFAGINPKKINEQGQFVVEDTGAPVFENKLGPYQVRTGAYAGYGYLGAQPAPSITTKGSWVSFKYSFTTRSLQEETRPVIRIVTNVQGETTGGITQYTGVAAGEFFYIKNIRIKEGFDTEKLSQGKNRIENKETTLLNIKDKREYNLSLSTGAANLFTDEALIFSKIKYPATTNSYTLNINDTSSIDTFTLEDLPIDESNLLGSALPFPVNSTTRTASYGRSDIVPHDGAVESNTPADLINSPNGFIPLGNPILIGSGTDNTPYTTTYENIGKYAETPFGNRDVIWEARNTDQEFKSLTKTNKTANGTGGVQGTYENVPVIDHNSPNAASNDKNLAIGTGAKIRVVINSSGGIQSQFLQSTGNGGFNYGINHNQTFGIPLKLAIGQAHYNLQTGSGARTNDVGDSPDKTTAAVKGASQVSFSATAKVFNSDDPVVAKTVYQLHNPEFVGDGSIPVIRPDKIKVGQKVTGAGISGNVFVTAIDYKGTTDQAPTYVTVTFDTAISLANDAVPTFTDQTTSLAIDTLAPFIAGGGAGNIKVGMNVTGTGVPASAKVSSIVHSSPSQSRFILDKPITSSLTDNVALTFEDDFWGLRQLTGYTIKGNTQSTSGSDSPLQNKTDFSYQDGGFKSPIIEIDNTKLHRVSIWAKADDTTFTTDSPNMDAFTKDMGAQKIIRWQGSNDSGLATPLEINNGNNASNVGLFFKDFDFGVHSATNVATSTGVNNNQWFLIVAHIHPAGTDAFNSFTNHADTGIYIPDNNGTKLRSITNTKQGDWIFSPGIKYMRVEALHNGNIRTGNEAVQFYAPRIDVVDGTEPSIKELTSGEIIQKNKSFNDNRAISILNWNVPLSDVTKPLTDYKHIIEPEKFNIKVNKSFTQSSTQIALGNNDTKSYADMIEQKINASVGTTESIFTLDFTGKTGNVSIILPLRNTSGTPMNASVDWGDGTSHIIRNSADADLYHTYTSGGGNSYTIRVGGQYQKIMSNGNTTSGSSNTASSSDKTTARANWRDSLTSVYLGNAAFITTGLRQGFENCTALKTFTTKAGITNTSAVTNLQQTFAGCTSLETLDMSGMDTGNVTTMQNFHKVSAAKNLTLIGFHNRDLSSLSVGAGKGMADAWENVTINTEEYNRCLIAWANNTFATTKKGRSQSGAADSTRFFADLGSSKYNTFGKRTSATDTSETNEFGFDPAAARTILTSDTGGSASSPNMGWTLVDGGQV